ncbi:relaxase/mobilization nuclease domain-containing protein [Tabrizicola oligotrophica]|uniref:Relaxase/mobilization nuclease domain-containing protein n=1 Tax=Tabrizicola oligotrophica TaxID=2710650 RepID=A0A6M0QWY9_9RHOB|nr:relaxase/mobilization nuclease domain-containing protein [Tabrizicola oligotrophica]NEY92008.1 relaxase/mobilization nuclease domain-containing protein [Tabrizicola oligotrophica]
MSQSSAAAVLKKITKGGTQDARSLKVQMNYLFSKAEAVFGNMVEHDPEARSIDPETRGRIVADWSDAWTGTPKNGHTTHLLLSFPTHVRPAKATLIAEAWAAEMFQSGEHQDEEWAYVAALHTDRAHPHVHIVVNNRGLMNDSWFYMAKDHVFNLAMMKHRMAEIAEEEGVYLDCSSRLERGILSYGPSRGEIERARREGRAVVETARIGPALETALAEVRANAATLRDLSMLAGLTGFAEVSAKMRDAAEVLERGGVIHPMREVSGMAGSSGGIEAGQGEAVQGAASRPPELRTRRDLEAHFGEWMHKTEDRIAELAPEKQAPLRKELHEIASDVVKSLGDNRGAELMREPPKTPLYSTEIKAHVVKVGAEELQVSDAAREKLAVGLKAAAVTAGIDPGTIEKRLARSAATAFEERDWIKSDITQVAARHKLDLGQQAERGRAAEIVDAFYEKAAKLIGETQAAERQRDDQTLPRALKSMAKVHAEHGAVRFEQEDQVRLFAGDMAARYGSTIIRDLAAGRDQALAKDIPDPKERLAIARAIVSAGLTHESVGLTLSEAKAADRALEVKSREQLRDPHARERSRDLER